MSGNTSPAGAKAPAVATPAPSGPSPAFAKMTRCRSRLLITQPFFGTLSLHLRMVENAEPWNRTMATDGATLFFNPDFTMKLSEPETVGVIAHEILHCAYMHHTRRQARDPRLWNIAADYAINLDLTDAGFKLPTWTDAAGNRCGPLLDQKYKGMGTEEIYRRLEKQGGKKKPRAGSQGAGARGAGGPGGNDPGDIGDGAGMGRVLDAAPSHDHSANGAAEADWQMRVRQAVAVAKGQNAGTLPAGIARLIDALNAPKVDWKAELRRFTDESAMKDYSWMTPNRRHVAAGLILPGFVSDRPSHLVCVVDTSGSIGTVELTAFISEIQAMLDEGAADRVSIVYADTEGYPGGTFDAGDMITVEAKGGGGTAFRRPLEHVASHHPDASAIIYLTDAYTSDWGAEPACPIIWAVTGQAETARKVAAGAPFGESVFLDA